MKIILPVLAALLLLQSCSIEKKFYGGFQKVNSPYHHTSQKVKEHSFADPSSDSSNDTLSPAAHPQPGNTNIYKGFEKNKKTQRKKQLDLPKTTKESGFSIKIKETTITKGIENKLSKKQAKGNFKKVLIWILGIGAAIGLTFLIGLAIYALFPGLSLLAAILIAVPILVLLVLLALYLIVSVISPVVC